MAVTDRYHRWKSDVIELRKRKNKLKKTPRGLSSSERDDMHLSSNYLAALTRTRYEGGY